MNLNLLRLLVAIGVGFGVYQSSAQQASLTMGINRKTGQLIATDIWNSRQFDQMTNDIGRTIDGTGPWHNRLLYILGSTFELEADGTNLDCWVIIGRYDLAVNTSSPSDWVEKLWVDVTDKNELIGGAYFGHSLQYVNDPEPIQSLRLIKVDVLSKENWPCPDCVDRGRVIV
jgi:hypothetical protein